MIKIFLLGCFSQLIITSGIGRLLGDVKGGGNEILFGWFWIAYGLTGIVLTLIDRRIKWFDPSWK